MPRVDAVSSDHAQVMFSMNAFTLLYVVHPGTAAYPPKEPILTTRPRSLFMSGKNTFVTSM